jgi:hypothetical protein
MHWLLGNGRWIDGHGAILSRGKSFDDQAAVRTGSTAAAAAVLAAVSTSVLGRAREGAISAQRSLTRMASRKRTRNCSSL